MCVADGSRMRSLLASLALGMTIFASGCFVEVVDDDDDTFDQRPAIGDLSVAWTFDGFGDCGDVRDVHILLIDPDGFIYDDTRYSCAVSSIVYEAVDQGWWSVELSGIDRYGRTIYFDSEDIWVEANAFNEFDLDLRVR